MERPPAFAADAMLGTLARWLRLLGYDCFYDKDVTDERLQEIARAQGRVLLTRDRRVAAKHPRALFVPPGDLDDELVTVCRALSLAPPEQPPTTRCSMCNALLVRADLAALEGDSLPPRVRERQLEVWRCPNCARLYWRGTHFESMTVRLRRLRERLGEPGGAGPAP